MGIIFSRFRKKKTTLELLQKLEDQIKDIEEYSSNTEQRYKRIVRQLLVYSLGLYVLLGVFCYFYLATSLKQKIIYCLLLVLSPIIFFFVKKLISWYYVRKINTNQSKLAEMKQEKKRLLEEVMDKETYKVAKDILEKFAPETFPKKPQPLVLRAANIQSTPLMPPSEGLRKRSGIINPDGEVSRPSLPPSLTATPRNSIQAPTPAFQPNKPAQGMAMLPLPAPILPRERTYLDRVVEYLIGDGPANRYALICSQCQSHNGMALKEEFEYIGFRCCYCFNFNPARKQRPEAPKLPHEKNSAEPADSESDESCLASSEESAPDRDRSDTEDTRGALNDTLESTRDCENEEPNDRTLQQDNVGTSTTPSKKFSPPNDENACFSPVCYSTSESDSNSVFPSNKKIEENLVETDLEDRIDKGDTVELSSTTNDIELIDLLSQDEVKREKVDHIDSENKEILVNNDSTSEVLET